MELTQLPVQACGALPGDGDGRYSHAAYFTYQFIYGRATECGLPNTVTLTPPAPTTCDGAITRLMGFEM